jgi:probable rRNA maturation factor|uniref:rRNA maturation RNase YbeY n=1 Tax=Candidatus Planktophila sp. TaxID=2175601 RepID=UPI0040497045
MTVELVNRSGALVPETQMHTLLNFGIDYMELNPECEISLTFVDPQEMEELHIKWMDEPGTTDVLSFPMDLPEKRGDIVTLGDIVIAPAVAAKQALEAGHSTEHEIYILATHGLLHILGYDHADPDEEKVMFALQEKIVKEWSQK